MAEPLCFCKIGFALAPGRFCQLPLDGDACQMSNMLDRVLFTRTRAARLVIIHGEGSDHFSFRGKDRRGPTSAERVSQRKIAKIRPQWIGRDIRDDDLFTPVGSGSA